MQSVICKVWRGLPIKYIRNVICVTQSTSNQAAFCCSVALQGCEKAAVEKLFVPLLAKHSRHFTCSSCAGSETISEEKGFTWFLDF